ncbi:MAG: hypothetical protein KKD44_28075 [Proteobacteria bacterium]|nr:hypothetical protein [Pseudomonadota bacterium]
MSQRIYKTYATGAAAIAATQVVPAVPTASQRRLTDVHVHFDVAPAAAANLTITLNAVATAPYDTLLSTASMVGLTDYVWFPNGDLWLAGGDSIDVAYANADARTYGVTITMTGEA